MKRWPLQQLGTFYAGKTGSVDPSKFPDEIFDLYSIPAFDRGVPEVRAGNAIGSSKQVVQPEDVLLSRIVPHIRRAWVVGSDRGKRLIASGEWIVFRTRLLRPAFLRYFVISNTFHERFMKTVSGVGGSLLRAKPGEVAKIPIPVPPLSEQERIVKLLDEADELRKLRAQADSRTAQLIPALFHEMFGDLGRKPTCCPIFSLGKLIAEGPQNGLYKHSSAYGSGTPILRIDAFYDGVVTDVTALKRLRMTPEEVERYGLKANDIVINRVNSPEYLGKSALIPELPEVIVFESNMMRFKVATDMVEPGYLIRYLQTSSTKRHILARAKHSINQSSINQEDVKCLPVPVPPLPLQKEFAKRVNEIREMEAAQAASRQRAEDLFQSMLHRAFNGEL